MRAFVIQQMVLAWFVSTPAWIVVHEMAHANFGITSACGTVWTLAMTGMVGKTYWPFTLLDRRKENAGD